MIRIATRGSALARWQAERVGDAARRATVELVLVDDRPAIATRRSDLHAIGGTGVFVKEVQQAVLDGRADLAVHSAKDLPVDDPAGLVLAAVPERGRSARRARRRDARRDSRPAARIGTGSVRRRAQLAAARPDLVFAPLRGNIETRLRKQRRRGLRRGRRRARRARTARPRRRGRPRCSTRRCCCRRSRKARSAVECRADDAAHARAPRRDRRRRRAPRGARRARVPRRARRRLQPPVRRARDASTSDRRVVLDALLASLDGHIVLRTRVDGPRSATRSARPRRADLLDAKGGRALLDVGADVERA